MREPERHRRPENLQTARISSTTSRIRGPGRRLTVTSRPVLPPSLTLQQQPTSVALPEIVAGHTRVTNKGRLRQKTRPLLLPCFISPLQPCELPADTGGEVSLADRGFGPQGCEMH